MRGYLWTRSACFCLLALTACGSKTTTSNAVTMGFIYPYSNSPLASGAVLSEAGVRVAQSIVNEAGGVVGSQVQVKTYDQQNDDATLLEQVNKAINDDHVSVIEGFFYGIQNPNTFAELVSLSHDNKVPFINMSLNDPSINASPDRDFIVGMLSSGALESVYTAQGKDFADKATKIAMVSPGPIYTEANNPFAPAAQHYATSSVSFVYIGYDVLPDYSGWDATATARAIEDANVDGVYFGGGANDSQLIISKIQSDDRIHPTFWLTSASFNAAQGLPDGSRGGIRLINGLVPDPNANLTDFGTAYKNWNNGTALTDPGQLELAAQSFDGAMWGLLALDRAGAIRDAKIAAALPDIFALDGSPINTLQVKEAFAALKTGPIRYRTALRGQLELDAHHDGLFSVAVFFTDASGNASPVTVYDPGQPSY